MPLIRTSRATRIAAVAAIASFGGLLAGGFTPAHAATGSTQVTFSIASGSLSISVPASATAFSLTQTGPDYVGTTTFPTTTVTDTRGGSVSLPNSVTVTATSTGFNGQSTSTALPASDASIVSGVVSFVPGMAAVGTGLTGTNLGGTGEQVMLGTTVGSGSATYSPILTITVPQASAVADTYKGNVVQTAS